MVPPFGSSSLALQRGLPGFPGRRHRRPTHPSRRCRFNGVSLVSQGEGPELRRCRPVEQLASTGSPWFPREKGSRPRGSSATWSSFNGVSLVSQGEGERERRARVTGLGASTGSPWFPREKADARHEGPAGEGQASTGSPWFPREKDHYHERTLHVRCGGFNGVSLVSQGEGGMGTTMGVSKGALQRGLPGFPGRRGLAQRGRWPDTCFNGVSLVSQGEGRNAAFHRSTPWVLQRGLPGFPGRRQGRAQPGGAHRRASTGSPGFPREKGVVSCRRPTADDASTGSPWFPREKADRRGRPCGPSTRFNGVSLVSQGEGSARPPGSPALPSASTGSPWFPREKVDLSFAVIAEAMQLQRGLPGFPGRREPLRGARTHQRPASTGSPWFPREKVRGPAPPP